MSVYEEKVLVHAIGTGYITPFCATDRVLHFGFDGKEQL